MMVYPRVTTNEAGSKDSWLVFVKPMEVTFASDDSIGYDVRREFWRLPEGFDIYDGITIPAPTTISRPTPSSWRRRRSAGSTPRPR
jgi:hypothetical protein